MILSEFTYDDITSKNVIEFQLKSTGRIDHFSPFMKNVIVQAIQYHLMNEVGRNGSDRGTYILTEGIFDDIMSRIKREIDTYFD